MASIIRGSDNFDSLASSGLGDGQTWQDVTASRTESVTYTNTTGKAIMVAVSSIDSRYSTQPNAGTSGVSIYVDGSIVYYGGNTSGGTFFVVPNNSTYSVIGYEVAYDNIYSWWELR